MINNETGPFSLTVQPWIQVDKQDHSLAAVPNSTAYRLLHLDALKLFLWTLPSNLALQSVSSPVNINMSILIWETNRKTTLTELKGNRSYSGAW